MIGALELNPTVAFSMVDRMLGGTGESDSPNRPLTEIEQNVVDSVVNLLLDNLTEKWRAVTNVQFKIHGRETRPQMLQVMGPNETVILMVFDVRVGDARGMLNLCIPAAAIEAVGETFAQGWNRPRRQPTAEETAFLSSNLGRIPLAITAEIATTLSARDMIELEPGDILSLGRACDQPLNVHVAGLPAFVGHLTQRNGSLAISVQPLTADSPEGTIA
jgi:flagellar motor switch protein FliM